MYKAIILVLCATCLAKPYNGGFEFYDYDEAPIGWEWINMVKCEKTLYPDISSGGGPYFWRIDPVKGLKPFTGERMLTLTTSSNDEIISQASRVITVHPGKILKGVFFWGTCDYVPYNDYLTVSLIPLEQQIGTPTIDVLRYDISDIGDYSSFGGWMGFKYEFTPEQTGRYYLTIFTSDYLDAVLSSQAAFDNLSVCDDDAKEGDFNYDCTVDFYDFALFAKDWLLECGDPYVDCLLGTDIDGSGKVDETDLGLMAEYWLLGEKIWHSRVDINENGVNLIDFAQFADSFGKSVAEYDYNANGMVEETDLKVFNAEYLR